MMCSGREYQKLTTQCLNMFYDNCKFWFLIDVKDAADNIESSRNPNPKVIKLSQGCMLYAVIFSTVQGHLLIVVGLKSGCTDFLASKHFKANRTVEF